MTYEELKQKEEQFNRDAKLLQNVYTTSWDGLYRKYERAEQEYINERLPFPFKKRQLVEITLQVTEETRETIIDEKLRRKKKYQVGYTYKKIGRILYYIVGKHGELRPQFAGMDSYYSPTDKIIAYDAYEDEYHCVDCASYRDGGCWASGYIKPDQPTTEDSCICRWFNKKIKND
jgi:hypothetical protein